MTELLESRVVAGLLVVGLLGVAWLARSQNPRVATLDNREEVVFWHFWGGADRAVVDDVVRRFNESQDRYRVRAIAMPGNNLQAKLFLSIAGGDPPDLVNQDDPVVADWASRGFILPLDAIADESDVRAIRDYLFPAARKLGQYDNRLFAVCNGLDIRALYYNRTALQRRGLEPPASLAGLDRIATEFNPPGLSPSGARTFGYLPDSRRLWAWGYVFGGSFYDSQSDKLTLDDPPIVAAATWMQQYARWYGADTINRYRAGDQSLPGKAFPLLPVLPGEMTGRYVVLMDGQWRTRDIEGFLRQREAQGLPAPEFGVCPLPPPPGGPSDAGWVNGNVFVVPRGGRNPAGAVAFMKFWIGLDQPAEAAATCAAGGWIPVSPQVVRHPRFARFLEQQPLFAEFVRLAASPGQQPVPLIPGAAVLKRTVEQAAAEIMDDPGLDPGDVLEAANRRLNRGRAEPE